MWEYAVVGAAGVLIGVLADRLIVALNKKRKEDYEQTLIKAFGNPIYLNEIGLDDVYEWANARKEKLAGGSKVVIMRANAKQLRDYVADLPDSGSANSLMLMALIDCSGEKPCIAESILIKFANLEQALESELAKGNGALVVEG